MTEHNKRYRKFGVYLGSSMDPDHPQDQHTATEAKIIGEGMAERNVKLVYGGGSRGLMGVVSKACLDAGGEIEGYLIPEFVQGGGDEDADYPQKPYDRVVHDINTRKDSMYTQSDGFFILPGGIGTDEELMDILGKQYLQTYWDESHAEPLKPIIIVNVDSHYDWFDDRIDNLIYRKKASPEAKKLFKLVSDAKAALEALDAYEAHGPEIVNEPIGNVYGTISRKAKD
jgi:uncharacterized protein (TIGR00730 family)